ncbi:RagB/SusD family nutrient uptake outer membrane protein [Segetibacter koreensis]|uniref:RagB/SusD family nutrient uptake outer membrane protein n=1 Tax=Segetibacter koreensis TaxID=398037 RepID=UPI000526C1C2|nr:RagB/SusD family nutrient uptake outer membrane protein [Segetibacter koreensis]
MRLVSKTIFSAMSFFMVASCTKLDETDVLYDQVTTDQFFKTDREFLSAVGAAYTNLYGYRGSFVNVNEVTSDEIVVPTRGADWGDGGHWVRLKLHTYKPTDSEINGAWNNLYAGISTCNRLISTLEPVGTDQSKAYIAELKVLRAIYYYWLLDTYGNVPLSIDFKNTTPPPNSTRQQIYDFIEKEILDNVSQLPKSGPNDQATYGRVNYYTGYAALAKLYLNAGIYTGTAQWDKAISACDTIINSGKYSLTANYKDNFVKENTGASEFIWAIPYDQVHAKGFNLDMQTLHQESQRTYNVTAQPWNGFASVQEFYQSYIDPTQNPGPQGSVVGLDPKGTPTTGTLDKRLSNFLVGPQYDATGKRLMDGAVDATDPDGPQLTFTPYINELQPGAWRQSGARIGKWEFYNGMTDNMSNDFAIFRYADFLLVKAEAVARKNNNWNHPIALALVNQIRTQHGGVAPFATMDDKSFLAERGREMFDEAYRRQDMIRFDNYNSSFRFHPADADKHVNILPIPEAQINSNPNLKQNPGY